LDDHDSIEVSAKSSLYLTAPWGRINQPDFTNAVAALETHLGAEELLAVLLQTELDLGRTRELGQWGPRVIDLDLLLYGDLVLNKQNLQLPHAQMHRRAFVLVPLLELNSELVIPQIGPARECLESLENQAVKKIK
jgi:2-amino-4-hydroxy-6-hydroxymethyldihydropteridine diphosphokinase